MTIPITTLHSGATIPAMGLGTWQLTNNTSDAVQHAIARGYRLIDTSSDYGTQPGIGDAISAAGVPREELYITTKVEETDDAYERTLCNLHELDLEKVELMLIHRSPKSGAGEQLWEDLIRAREEGLVDDIGVSNYSISLIEDLIAATSVVPAVNQIEWSPFGRSTDMLQYCKENEILIQAYCPLTRTERLDNETLAEIAGSYGKNPAQVLIRWNIQLGTIPIPKANQENHQQENLDVFDFELSGEDMQKLEKLNEHYSALGSLPYI